MVPDDRRSHAHRDPKHTDTVLAEAGDLSEHPPGSLRPASVRFDDDGVMGRGGMGSVHRVVDKELHRRVAMKVLHDALESNEDAVQRFVAEARITGQLDHPHIVPVHELGVDATGRHYFVMKLVVGRTLEAEIYDGDALPFRSGRLDALIDALLKVCDAVAFAHDRGVVHGDIKPQNIMVGTFGQVYLMDWGMARADQQSEVVGEVISDPSGVGDPRRSVVRSSGRRALVGTPAYAAPEQSSGQRTDIDARTDVYLLGGVLYEMLTRHTPHGGGTYWETVFRSTRGDVTPVEENVAEGDFPPALARIAMKALAADREERYASVAALRADIERYVRGTDRFVIRRWEAGELIVREGDVGGTAYILTGGRCEVFKTVDGRRRTLRHLVAGDVFGETAVLTDRPRSASVEALEPVTAFELTRESITEQLGANAWLGRFVRTLAERFREIDARLTELEQSGVER
jgi:CRP-like cAMP-binding protein/tRNA A-37 threonylcarbamoyl transferase component Bud32